MEIDQEILREISQITREIEDSYPELQKYLDETPMTLTNDDDNKPGEIDKKTLSEYLESLRSIVKKYKEEH